MYGEYQARVKSTRECEPQHRAEASLAAAQPVRHGAEDGRPDPDPGEEERAQKLHRGPGSKKKKKKKSRKEEEEEEEEDGDNKAWLANNRLRARGKQELSCEPRPKTRQTPRQMRACVPDMECLPEVGKKMWGKKRGGCIYERMRARV